MKTKSSGQDGINWRMRLAMWPIGVIGEFMGTVTDTNPRGRAARRWLRRLLITEADSLAVASILIARGIIDRDGWERARQRAAQDICRQLEKEFPGLRASEIGVDIDLVNGGQVTMANWPS